MDCDPPGSSVHVILQARILNWVAFPFFRGSSWPRDRILVSCIARSLTVWAIREALTMPNLVDLLLPHSVCKPKNSFSKNPGFDFLSPVTEWVLVPLKFDSQASLWLLQGVLLTSYNRFSALPPPMSVGFVKYRINPSVLLEVKFITIVAIWLVFINYFHTLKLGIYTTMKGIAFNHLLSQSWCCYYYSVQFSRSLVSDSLQPHESQHARPPCPSPTPGVHSDSCPLSQWCHPAISSSVVPSLPALNLSQHQGLFEWASSSHQVAKVLEFQLQHQSFQWTSRTDLL